MTFKSNSIKTIAIGSALLAFGASAAFAGEGHAKDCNKASKVEASTYAPTTQTTLSSAVSETQVMAASAKAEKMKKVYSFDEAVELCTSKQVADLQACVDKKTGQTPQS